MKRFDTIDLINVLVIGIIIGLMMGAKAENSFHQRKAKSALTTPTLESRLTRLESQTQEMERWREEHTSGTLPAVGKIGPERVTAK